MMADRTATRLRWWLKYGLGSVFVTTVVLVASGGIGALLSNTIFGGLHTSTDPGRVFIDGAAVGVVVAWPVLILFPTLFVVWLHRNGGHT